MPGNDLNVDMTGAIDPELAEVIAAFGAAGGMAPGADQLAALRGSRAVTYDLEPPEGVVREDRLVRGAPGDPDVEIRVFRPTSPVGPVPAFLWIHGGGYILGSHEGDKPRLDRLVQHLGCVAVSVEYRLAPEVPYPGPLDDCYAALDHVVAEAAELGIDAGRIAVGGASAGGGLAAGLALLARDRGVPLVHQHLIYPMIDDRRVTPSSRWIVPIWSREMNEFGWQSYLGGLYGTDDVPASAAATRATDLTGLPPTYMHVGTLDGFLHEDLDYAGRLLAAGVQTELHVYPGAPHGFDGLGPTSSLARRANAESDLALARVLTP